jgi:hypothetical protein
MDKTTHFFGTSVFGQLISLIDSKIISKSVVSPRPTPSILTGIFLQILGKNEIWIYRKRCLMKLMPGANQA